MRGDEALRTIPTPYARALQLAASGSSDEEVAESLDVDEASVPSMLALAAAKLVTALNS